MRGTPGSLPEGSTGAREPAVGVGMGRKVSPTRGTPTSLDGRGRGGTRLGVEPVGGGSAGGMPPTGGMPLLGNAGGMPPRGPRGNGARPGTSGGGGGAALEDRSTTGAWTLTSPLGGGCSLPRSAETEMSSVSCAPPSVAPGVGCEGRPSDGMCVECNEGFYRKERGFFSCFRVVHRAVVPRAQPALCERTGPHAYSEAKGPSETSVIGFEGGTKSARACAGPLSGTRDVCPERGDCAAAGSRGRCPSKL
jgi:hypothetical protein